MDRIKFWMLALVAVLFTAGTVGAQTLTNTASAIYTSTSGAFASAFDGLIALAVLVLTITTVYGLVRRWVGRKGGKIG